MNRGDAVGRYRIDSPLGGGGMGVVYLAEDLTHFTDERPIIDYRWSRDGKRLAIARSSVTNDIVLFKGLKK